MKELVKQLNKYTTNNKTLQKIVLQATFDLTY